VRDLKIIGGGEGCRKGDPRSKEGGRKKKGRNSIGGGGRGCAPSPKREGNADLLSFLYAGGT